MTGIDAHISSAHMVLSRDLNPHDTLFAGQGTSYMIECAFLAVQSFLPYCLSGAGRPALSSSRP